MIRPGLFALIYALLFFLPAWAIYRWSVLKGHLVKIRKCMRLFLFVVSGNIFLATGGEEALTGLEALLGLVDPAGAVPTGILVNVATTILLLAAGFFLAELLDAAIFETRLGGWKGRDAPRLLRDTLKLVVIAATVGFILVQLYAVDATMVGGGAAVLTLVLGLALQNVLGDLFSGVVLQIERPFSKGDWIRIGEQEGEVIEFNWRATRLSTRTNVGVVIPNSVVAKAEIRNLSLNEPYTAVDRYVGTEYKEPPNRIKSVIMDAVLQVPDVLRQPHPMVWTDRYGDSAIIYHMRFWVRDYLRIPEISDEVMTAVWYAFKRHAVTIPWPIRNIYMREETIPTPEEHVDMITDLLRQVDLLTPLSRDQLHQLAEGLAPKFYGRGEVLIRQGEEGDSFFVIQQGRVQVSITPEGSSQETPVAVLGPRDFFGEMSLLAGDRRNATVRALEDARVIIIDHDSFARIMQSSPEVVAEITTIYYSRTEELVDRREEAAAQEMDSEDAEVGERALLRRIQRFFGL